MEIGISGTGDVATIESCFNANFLQQAARERAQM
jgi:hypothetical protein